MPLDVDAGVRPAPGHLGLLVGPAEEKIRVRPGRRRGPRRAAWVAPIDMEDTVTPTTLAPSPAAEAVRAAALRSFALMRDGTLADFEALVHPDAINREAVDEPPECRPPGPAAFHATAVWLRAAFAGLDWEIHDVVVQGDLAAVHCTMSGTHVRTFVAYDAEARVADAFPPTGRSFAVTQTHWLRVRGGMVTEHWANRDDLGMAMQLGWAPPGPAYLVRMALAKRRARR